MSHSSLEPTLSISLHSSSHTMMSHSVFRTDNDRLTRTRDDHCARAQQLEGKRSNSETDAEARVEDKKSHWWSWSWSHSRRGRRSREGSEVNVLESLHRTNHNSSAPTLVASSASASVPASSPSCRTSLESTECVRATSLTGREQKALEKREREIHKLQKRRERRAKQEMIDGLCLGGL